MTISIRLEGKSSIHLKKISTKKLIYEMMHDESRALRNEAKMNEIPLGDRVLKWHDNLVGYVHYREMLVSTTKLVRYRCFEFEAMR